MGVGTKMCLLNIVEVIVRKQNNGSHLVSPEKAQNSSPGSCHFHIWMDLGVPFNVSEPSCLYLRNQDDRRPMEMFCKPGSLTDMLCF